MVFFRAVAVRAVVFFRPVGFFVVFRPVAFRAVLLFVLFVLAVFLAVFVVVRLAAARAVVFFLPAAVFVVFRPAAARAVAACFRPVPLRVVFLRPPAVAAGFGVTGVGAAGGGVPGSGAGQLDAGSCCEPDQVSPRLPCSMGASTKIMSDRSPSWDAWHTVFTRAWQAPATTTDA